MKNLQYILILALAFAFASCVGQKEPSQGVSLTISTSLPMVSVDAGESVQISVKNYSVDVTEQSHIYYLSAGEKVEVEGGLFTPSEAGDYLFYADYQDAKVEHPVPFTAYSDAQLTSEPYRRSLMMKFTGTWCVNCPKMGYAIEELAHERAHRIVEMALHSNDDLQVEEGKNFAIDYNFWALPTVLTNMSLADVVSTPSMPLLESAVDKTLALNPATAALRIGSELSGSKLDIEVGVKSTASVDYKIAVAVVVDNYHYAQTGATDPNYKQNNVLRFYVTPQYGESLGVVAADNEVVRTYSAELPKEALESECRVIAYVMNLVAAADNAYVVNNATQCIAGDSIGYLYELSE